MIRVILVDDEPLSLKSLEMKLNEFDSIKVVKSFSNVNDLLNEGQTLDFQVAFLDVEMPGLDGLELAKILKQWKKDLQIVLATAHRDYAIQAFDLYCIDYLLKPISTSRLKKTIDRIQENIQLAQGQLPSSQTSNPSIKIQCLGGFNVYQDNQIVHWRTVKTKELFAFLFSNLHVQVQRDTILDTIWAEKEYQKARVQLHTTISYLRTTLNSLGYVDVLKYANESYVLQLDNFQCDIFELEQILENINKTGEIDVEKAESFIQDYRGDYMEGMDYPWLSVKVNFLHKQLNLLLNCLISHYTNTLEFKKRENILLLSLENNPYSDKTIQLLMQHYAETDNRTDAVKVYRTFKENLMTDLGILPAQEISELFEQIANE